MKLKEHDVVRLTKDLAPSLPQGKEGTIIHLYGNSRSTVAVVEFQGGTEDFPYPIIEDVKTTDLEWVCPLIPPYRTFGFRSHPFRWVAAFTLWNLGVLCDHIATGLIRLGKGLTYLGKVLDSWAT